jgi:phosphatidylserine decarboxylase
MLITILLSSLLVLITMLPLAWKWQLGMVRIGAFAELAALLAALLLFLPGNRLPLPAPLQVAIIWCIAVAGTFALLAYRFYRDPERSIPVAPGAIVSPADGKVIYIREVHRGTLPVATKQGKEYLLCELTKMSFYTEEAIIIGISMNFMDVHVNRAPVTGRVSFQCHFPGRFGSLRDPAMVFENERATTVFEQGDLQIAIVQIASRLVRQIVSYVAEGQQVARGQRFGVIRFGSQVDMILPSLATLHLQVKPGDRVRAGESIIAMDTTPVTNVFSSIAAKDEAL